MIEYFPSAADFERLSREASEVPVYREVNADRLTPVLAHATLPREPGSYLLESDIGALAGEGDISVETERIDAIQPSLRKSGGERNAEFAARFRQERPAFVAHWDEYRGRMGAAAYRAMLAEADASAAPNTAADR